MYLESSKDPPVSLISCFIVLFDVEILQNLGTYRSLRLEFHDHLVTVAAQTKNFSSW